MICFEHLSVSSMFSYIYKVCLRVKKCKFASNQLCFGFFDTFCRHFVFSWLMELLDAFWSILDVPRHYPDVCQWSWHFRGSSSMLRCIRWLERIFVWTSGDLDSSEGVFEAILMLICITLCKDWVFIAIRQVFLATLALFNALLEFLALSAIPVG